MDILASAVESATETANEPDDPAFGDLLRRVTLRIAGLGTTAPSEDVAAATLAIVQDVAQYTLAWVEPESVDSESADQIRGTTLFRSEDNARAERRW